MAGANRDRSRWRLSLSHLLCFEGFADFHLRHLEGDDVFVRDAEEEVCFVEETGTYLCHKSRSAASQDIHNQRKCRTNYKLA